MATAGYLPPVVVEIIGNNKDLVAKLLQAKAMLRELAGEDTQARLGVTLGEFTTDLSAARVELLNFAKEVTNAQLGADAAPFWADIAKLRAELASTSPLDINVGTTLGTALAQIETLRGELALMQAQGMADTGGLGGAESAAGGAATNAIFGAAGIAHMAHLFTPEVVGLASALFAVGAGFTALGVASIGAASDIYSGASAVSAAHNAIAAAIPGTTQWQKGVVSLGQAWSAIPANLQPAVHAIQGVLGRMGSSPLATEIQQFLGGQAVSLGAMFSGAGSAFQPLIMATEHAIVTVEGMIKSSIGSGSLQRFVRTISNMVGPATVEIYQLVSAILGIAEGFAKAVTDGQGMEVLVGLFQRLATFANGSFFQGFVSGWVDFDRVLSTVLGLVLHFINILTTVGGSFASIAPLLGAVASGLLAVEGTAWLLQNVFSKMLGLPVDQFLGNMKGFAKAAIPVGIFAAGVTGLVGNITSLLHVKDPLTSVFHSIGGLIGRLSKFGTSANSTIGKEKKALQGAIPVTATFTSAQDLLIRSTQQIGSSLAGAATGFANFTVAVPQSYNKMLANLQNQNSTLASWAGQAQQLLALGVDPGAVTAMAQQAPQELGVALAHLRQTGAAGLTQFNAVWQEKLMVAQMSSSKGAAGMGAAMIKGFQSKTPAVHQAAVTLATTLGTALQTPFTGTSSSIQNIANQLNSLSPATVQALAGALGKTGLAASHASTASTKLKSHTASLGSTLLSTAANAGMVAMGFSGTVKAVKGVPKALGAVAGKVGSFIGDVGNAASAVASFGQKLGAAALAGVVSLGELAAGMMGATIESTILNAALGVGVIGALVLLGVGIYELVTHWKTVWHAIVAAARAAAKALGAVWRFLKADAQAIWAHIAGVVKAVWAVIGPAVKVGAALVVGYVKVYWAILSTIFKVVWDVVAGVVKVAWDVIVGIVKVAIAIVTGIIKFFAALFTGNWKAMWNAIKGTVSTVWKDIQGIFLGAVGAMAGAGQAIMNALAGGFNAAVNAVSGAAQSVWNAVTGVFSGAARFLKHVGKAIVQGLANGISGAIHFVKSAMSAVVSVVKHIPIVGGLIGSPSPYFITVGHAIGEGLGIGVRGGAPKAISAVQGLALGVRAAGAGMGLGVAGAGVGVGATIHQSVNLTFTGTAPEPAAIARVTQKALAAENEKLVARLRTGTSRVGYR
ncbi:MAG: phage tail protein [Candidatus Dormibacteria bacterium]